MPVTYKKIASVTVGSGGAANIEFTSIPGTYTDLVCQVSSRSDTTTDYYRLQINNSTSNFTNRFLQGNGSAASSGSESAAPFGRIARSDSTASTFGNDLWYFPNYAGSTNKSISLDAVNENNGTLAYQNLTAGLWSQTTAITSIKFVPNSGNFAQYSTATLYGISKS